MSSPSAIASVTEYLRSLIADLGYLKVEALPPDVAEREGENMVNLFLYQVGINGALSNQEFPWQSRGGGDSQTHPVPFMLPLRLHYMLSVFAHGAVGDPYGHAALGTAMRVLHDFAQLSRTQIGNLPGKSQPEGLTITLIDLNTDELTKIWTACQSAYRLSVAYEVNVVLIDSELPVFSPKPVLRRGPADRGPVAAAGDTTPVLTALLRADGQAPFTTGFAGDDTTVILEGYNLGEAPRVRLRSLADPAAKHAKWVDATRQPASGQVGTAERCVFKLTAANIPAPGPLALAIEFPDPIQPQESVPDPARPGHSIIRKRFWHSNEVSLSMAPSIIEPLTVRRSQSGEVTIEVPIDVALLLDPPLPGNPPPPRTSPQRLALLLDNREIVPMALSLHDPAAPIFTVADLTPRSGHGVRLRVDGVDLPRIIKDTSDPSGRLLKFKDDPQIIIPP